MGEKISIAYYLSASAGTEADVELYTVDAARKFKLNSIYIPFPAASDYELELSFYKGIKKIMPYKNTYRGDDNSFDDCLDEEFQSGERLILHYKNNNVTTIKKAFILVRGELT